MELHKEQVFARGRATRYNRFENSIIGRVRKLFLQRQGHFPEEKEESTDEYGEKFRHLTRNGLFTAARIFWWRTVPLTDLPTEKAH
mgnify:CR=1 FL=1